MERLRDGVYVQWFRRTRDDDALPESIVVVRNSWISLHVNPFDERVIRHPLRSSIGEIRLTLARTANRDEYVRRSHELVTDYWHRGEDEVGEVDYFAPQSREAVLWASVGDSWWFDFDRTIGIGRTGLSAGLRAIGPHRWFVSIGSIVGASVEDLAGPVIHVVLDGLDAESAQSLVHSNSEQIARLMGKFAHGHDPSPA